MSIFANKNVRLPGEVWLFFFQDREMTRRSYRAVRAWNSDIAKQEATASAGQGYLSMEVQVDGAAIYAGEISVDKMLDRLEQRFADQLTPMVRCDAYVLSDEFSARIGRYLHAVQVLASSESDMEDIIAARDECYGEGKEIQECLDAIQSVREVDSVV